MRKRTIIVILLLLGVFAISAMATGNFENGTPTVTNASVTIKVAGWGSVSFVSHNGGSGGTYDSSYNATMEVAAPNSMVTVDGMIGVLYIISNYDKVNIEITLPVDDPIKPYIKSLQYYAVNTGGNTTTYGPWDIVNNFSEVETAHELTAGLYPNGTKNYGIGMKIVLAPGAPAGNNTLHLEISISSPITF